MDKIFKPWIGLYGYNICVKLSLIDTQYENLRAPFVLDNKNLTKIIKISPNKLYNILKEFNVYEKEYKNNERYFFTNISDCETACEYLEEVYGVILRLSKK
jgi:hypothetical protein